MRANRVVVGSVALFAALGCGGGGKGAGSKAGGGSGEDGGGGTAGGGTGGPSSPPPISCGVDAGSVEPDASVPRATWVDTLLYDPKSQIADIADVGSDAFVVGYVHASFRLRYTAFGPGGVSKTLPPPEGAKASWLRASSTPGWTIAGCDESYFAVDLADAVRLDAHRRCGGDWQAVTPTVVDAVSNFARPSLATRGTSDDGALLFVYGKGHQVLGRLQRFRSGAPDPFGAPFVIFEVDPERGVFSTDVIYNQHSNRFIVGEIERSMKSCLIQNAVVAVDGELRATVEMVRPFGTCDVDAGGHHTAVAYNPQGDGSYLWWRQDDNLRKAVYVHDAWGALATTPSFPTYAVLADPPSLRHRYTVPIASTGQTGTEYVFLKANIDDAGMSTSGLYGYTAGQAQPWSLLDVPPSFNGQVAVRYVGGRTVGLMRTAPSADVCSTTDLYLVSSDRP